jgi:hypothetical protein
MLLSDFGETLECARYVTWTQIAEPRLDLNVDPAIWKHDFDVFVSFYNDTFDPSRASEEEARSAVEMLIEEAAVDRLDPDKLAFANDRDLFAGKFLAARFRGSCVFGQANLAIE